MPFPALRSISFPPSLSLELELQPTSVLDSSWNTPGDCVAVRQEFGENTQCVTCFILTIAFVHARMEVPHADMALCISLFLSMRF